MGVFLDFGTMGLISSVFPVPFPETQVSLVLRGITSDLRLSIAGAKSACSPVLAVK